MTLSYLLLTLFTERMVQKPHYLRTDFYYTLYKKQLVERKLLCPETTVWQFLAMWLGPAISVAILLHILNLGLVTFVVTLFVLFVSIGSHSLREAFKCYLQAAERGDLQACDMYARNLGLPDHSPQTFAGHLVWLNYQRYAAPIFFFVVFNVFGVIAYGTLRVLNGYAQKHALGLQHTTQKILLVVEWVPVRLAAVGFLIVGHFSRALPVWLSLCFDTSTCAKDVLTRVAIAAEDVQSEPDDLVTEAVTLVSLAKRNILFILSIVAILTLLGVIQ